jgi:hypothetical protein
LRDGEVQAAPGLKTNPGNHKRTRALVSDSKGVSSAATKIHLAGKPLERRYDNGGLGNGCLAKAKQKSTYQDKQTYPCHS